MKKLLPLLLALTLLFSGCGGTNPAGDSPSSSGAAEPTASSGGEASGSGVNPLTGQPIEAFRVADRPVAVMLNNLKAALPQYGVSRADIIYEVAAEGGITRMVALYQNAGDVPRIGSVRSTRPYYLDIVMGHDAVLIHAGGSEAAYDRIKSEGITALDAVRGNKEQGLFWRDQERIRTAGYEHSVFTSGEKISSLLPTYGIRLRHEDDFEYRMKFAGDGTPSGGRDAKKITVVYSSYKTGIFEYDDKTGLYEISEYGKPYVDGETGKQVGVVNVLILRTDINQIPGDTAGRLEARMTGEGEGLFACGGKITEIRWSKASETDPFHYALKNGTELTLGRGTSYVNIISSGSRADAE